MEIREIKNEILDSSFIKELKEFFDDNPITSIALVLFIVFFINKESIWDLIDSIVTLVTAIAVFVNISTNKKFKLKGLEKIKIYFEVNGEKEPTPRFEIIRKDFTRAEIAGYLGVIQDNSQERYNINYLSSKKFFNDITEVQKGTLNEIIIVMDAEQQKKFRAIEL